MNSAVNSTKTVSIPLNILFDYYGLQNAIEAERRRIISDPTSDAEELSIVVTHDLNEAIITSVLHHPNATQEVIDQLAEGAAKSYYGFGAASRELVTDPRVTPAAAVNIARRSRDKDLSILVVERGDLSQENADDLPDMSNADGLKVLLAHGLASSNRIQRALNRGGKGAKKVIASSANAPEDTLITLSHDSDADIRAAVARNAAAPADRLRVMLADSNSTVAKAAERSLKRRNEPLEVEDDGESLSTSDPVFGYFFAQSDDATTRLNLAGNPGTDPETLRGLVEDDEQRVRVAAITNPSLPSDIAAGWLDQYLRLVSEEDGRYRNWGEVSALSDKLALALRNPATPNEFINTVFQMRIGLYEDSAIAVLGAHPDIDSDTLHTLLDSFRYGSKVQRKVASMPNVSEADFATMAGSYRFSVRQAVAGNQHAPEYVLRALANDDDERIAKRATKTLAALGHNV